MEGSGGTSLSAVRESFYPADPALVAIFPPNHCLRILTSNNEGGSRTPGLRQLCHQFLSRGQFIMEQPSSRERRCERLGEEFCCTQETCGLYRFQSAWKSLSCHLLKLLRISVSGSHFGSIPSWCLPWYSYFGTPVANVLAVANSVEGLRCYRGGGWSKFNRPCKLEEFIVEGYIAYC